MGKRIQQLGWPVYSTAPLGKTGMVYWSRTRDAQQIDAREYALAHPDAVIFTGDRCGFSEGREGRTAPRRPISRTRVQRCQDTLIASRKALR